jgi:type IV pilus assembly protein PilO
MTYNDAVDQLAGTLVLSTYDVTGSGRESQDVAVHNVPIGTNNIFSSGSFSADNSYNEAEGDSIINDYDIYVMANAYASDSESVVVGTAKDALGKTVASSNSNSVESVTITVTGVNGNYKVSYKVGATTYPVDNYFDGADLNVGDTLDLLIMSSSRLSTEDKAGAKINIVNSSDKQLNIKVLNDDASNPRISFGTTTGSIQLFR